MGCKSKLNWLETDRADKQEMPARTSETKSTTAGGKRTPCSRKELFKAVYYSQKQRTLLWYDQIREDDCADTVHMEAEDSNKDLLSGCLHFDIPNPWL